MLTDILEYWNYYRNMDNDCNMFREQNTFPTHILYLLYFFL